jgi:K+-sensing histidine kinase KdpD
MSIEVETVANNKERLQLNITHDGKAIPVEFREKIFLKNAQPELKKAGYKPARGLGLIFCRLAMEVQNGKLYLDTAQKDKNRFILEIPTYQSHKKDKNS